jgi:hypothetical protein
MMSWNELGSLCPACESHALRLQTDENGQKWDAVVYGCCYCGLYWIHGDHIWIEQESAENLAELLGRPRDIGVTLSVRLRIHELVTLASTARSI